MAHALRRRPALLAPLALLAALALLAPAAAEGTQGSPMATNVESLLTYPEFYVGKPTVLRGAVERADSRLTLKSDDGRVLRVVSDTRLPDGLLDLRGELLDVGRLQPDDPRATRYELARVVGEGREWPRPGDLLVYAVTAASDAVRSSVATIRSVVLQPAEYDGRIVTVRGQYRARNLFGDVPRAPGISRFDFLIESAGAAIWVTGMRPRGRGFDFSLDSKIDTERWLEVTGTVNQGRGLQWLDATDIRTAEAGEREPAAEEKPAVVVPPAPPPEVVFSIPTEGETEVAVTTTVRIQTSRDLDPESLKGHIRVGYVGAPATPPPAGEPIEFTATYDRGNRAITITFTKPLERFRTLKVELLEGITGTDKQPLAPWSLTFSLG